MNELLFIGFVLIDMLAVLFMLRHFGKWGLITFYVLHVVFVQLTILLQVDLFGWTVSVGSMLFAVLFLCTDLIAEHFGKKDGYTAVTLGAISLVLFLFVIQVSMAFTPSATSAFTETFISLFDGQLRITLADLVISYLLFQIFDVWFFHKIKEWTRGKMLWLRNIGSTWVSQTFIAVLFFQVAFAGVIEQSVLWQIITAGLAMKLFVALLDTPFIYLSKRFLPDDYRKSTETVGE